MMLIRILLADFLICHVSRRHPSRAPVTPRIQCLSVCVTPVLDVDSYTPLVTPLPVRCYTPLVTPPTPLAGALHPDVATRLQQRSRALFNADLATARVAAFQHGCSGLFVKSACGRDGVCSIQRACRTSAGVCAYGRGDDGGCGGEGGREGGGCGGEGGGGGKSGRGGEGAFASFASFATLASSATFASR